MSDEGAARVLFDFLVDVGDEAGDVVWGAALAYLEEAVSRAREGCWGRFRYNADGELRRLRQGLTRALVLADLAVTMVDADRERHRELTEELMAGARSARAAAGRAQTLPAQLARIERRRLRQEEGVDTSDLCWQFSRDWLEAAVEAFEHGRPIPHADKRGRLADR